MVHNVFSGAERGFAAIDDVLSAAGREAAAPAPARPRLAPRLDIDPRMRRAWAAAIGDGASAEALADPALNPALDHTTQLGLMARDLLQATEEAIVEARAVSERRSWDERAFDPAALVAEVIGLVRPRARGLGVELRLDPQGLEIPPVIGDPSRLQRILFKLIGGAIKSRQAGEVTISLRGTPQDHELALDIAVICGPLSLHARDASERGGQIWRNRWIDSELSFGITKDLQALVEERLEGADEAGLDLSVAIRLRLPMARVEPTFSQPKAAGPVAPNALKGMRILVAEDSDLNRELIQMLLTPFGCVVDEAVDGQAAIAAVEAQPQAYDAVLMDMNMPVVDGFEATRRIRARGDARALTPILAVTGRALSADIAKIRALGASGHVSKPFSTEELVQAILNCTQAG